MAGRKAKKSKKESTTKGGQLDKRSSPVASTTTGSSSIGGLAVGEGIKGEEAGSRARGEDDGGPLLLLQRKKGSSSGGSDSVVAGGTPGEASNKGEALVQNGGGVSNSNGNGNGNGNGDSYIMKGKKKKIFYPQDSILTLLSSKDKNIAALNHIFIIMIVTAILYSLLLDSVKAGMPYIDFAFYFFGFGTIEQQAIVLPFWLALQVSALLVYPTFKLWQFLHSNNSSLVRFLLVDGFFAALVLCFNIGMSLFTIFVILHYDLPPVPALVLCIEQTRLCMKSYSFIRENATKVLHPWKKDSDTGPAVWYQGQMDPKVGSFSQYLYFLFAPTLLYRDHYPRTQRIRISRVLSHLVKCAISVAFITVLIKEIFEERPKTGSTSQFFMRQFMTCMLWGLCIQFMAGYFFLHSWCNMFAELLRFADREFYSDWWTCTSYSSFYRKWNLLIHDWIKAYIYQDIKDMVKGKFFKFFASFAAIFISGVYHEYVLWAPFRFVLPILLTQYSTFGAVLYFVRPSPSSKFWNYFIHWSINFGVAIMVFCYAMEFCARLDCPEEVTLLNTFVPRSIRCFFN